MLYNKIIKTKNFTNLGSFFFTFKNWIRLKKLRFKFTLNRKIISFIMSSVTHPELWRCEQISLRRYRISNGRRGISSRRCASPAPPVGAAASPPGDVTLLFIINFLRMPRLFYLHSLVAKYENK
jgi:hypothetical protein